MKKYLPVFIILLCSLPSIFALLEPGFFLTDDGEWMAIRFSAFHQAFRDGQFPVRWLGRLNYNYGYPVANFLYPGFMYIGEFFYLLGFGFQNTIKVLLGISLVGSAFFSYLWLRLHFRVISSILGALFYLYTPYHLFNVYKRGSVGESLALLVFPFILWQVERKNTVATSIGIALLILSHNTLAFLLLPLLFMYCVIRVGTKKWILVSFSLGVLLSSFFWIPALYDLQFTIFSKTPVGIWGEHAASFTVIGVSSLFIFFFSLLFIRKERKNTLFLTFLILGILSTFLSSELTKNVTSSFSFVQFPFRLLSIQIFSVAFLSAFLMEKIRMRYAFFVVALLLLFFHAVPQLFPKERIFKPDVLYATNEDTTTVKNEYMPIWVKELPNNRADEKVTITGEGQIQIKKIKTNSVSFSVTAITPSVIQINTVYFPGWQATIDGKNVPISYANPKGIMELAVPKGDSEVEVWFGETQVRLIADVISIGALLCLGFIFLKKKTHSAGSE